MIGRFTGPKWRVAGHVTTSVAEVTDCSAVFVGHPTNRTSVAQSLLRVGPGHRAVAQTHPVFPKMSRAPSAFPYKVVPQAPGDKPIPSEEG